MEAAMHITGKKAAKIVGAACLTTGIVAFSAIVAGGAAVGAVVEGFKSAKNMMQKVLKGEETVAADEVAEEAVGEIIPTDGGLSESTDWR